MHPNLFLGVAIGPSFGYHLCLANVFDLPFDIFLDNDRERFFFGHAREWEG